VIRADVVGLRDQLGGEGPGRGHAPRPGRSAAGEDSNGDTNGVTCRGVAGKIGLSPERHKRDKLATSDSLLIAATAGWGTTLRYCLLRMIDGLPRVAIGVGCVIDGWARTRGWL
jgi:hypothetical protein